MAPTERRRRALDRGLFLADRVSRVAGATWLVPSQSDPRGVHAVALVDGYLHCDCYAAAAGQPCAHRAAVCLFLLACPASDAAAEGRNAVDARRSA
jgi:hypothetical protein